MKIISKTRKKLDVFLTLEEKVVSVARGYFYNYLFPRGLAALVTPKILSIAAANKDKIEQEKQLQLETMEKINSCNLHFTYKKNVFKSFKVSAADLINAINEEYSLKLKEENFIGFVQEGSNKLLKKITKYGTFKAKIQLKFGINAIANIDITESER